MKLLKNVLLYGEKVDIEIADGKIVSVQRSKEVSDATECVYPGLFDIHCHGMMGMDTSDGTGMEEMCRYMLAHGVVDWCPTITTMGIEKTKKAASQKCDIEDGANIVGYHMEGPYISMKYKGAQNPAFIKKPSLEEFESIENVATITIAPEIDGAMEFIKNCKVPVCIGHTDCTYEEAIEAIESGAVCLTHTCNAMPPLHHRNPGPIGAAAEKGIYAQVICDGFHLHKAMVLALYKNFGPDRMILISDNIRPAGLPDGEYKSSSGLEVTIKDGKPRLHDGTIAGSSTCLFDCVKKAIEFGIPEKQAFKMASETPYNMMGIKKGRIEAGYPADIIITDKDKNIKVVIKAGQRFEFN